MLKKIDITKDPGPMMNQLIDCFAQRSLITKCLSRVESISINLAKVIMILGKLCTMPAADIVSCLESPADQWERIINQTINHKSLLAEDESIGGIWEVYKQ